MSKNKSGCRCCKRYVSKGIHSKGKCLDVCVNPICGDPDSLTIVAPVVYDELGFNVCRSIPVEFCPDVLAMASCASVQVLNITFDPYTECGSVVSPISGRPNCYQVNLSDLFVTLRVTVFDCSKRIIACETVEATYLSSCCDDDCYDEDTNPNRVELEIFAPYGLAEPPLAYLGFTECSNNLRQGLNMIAIPKLLHFDASCQVITVGLSVIIKSVYFSQYKIPHNGKAIVPKAAPQTEDTLCEIFVSGDLLDLAIKPLELGPPKCEENLKERCCEGGHCEDPCSTLTPVNDIPTLDTYCSSPCDDLTDDDCGCDCCDQDD